MGTILPILLTVALVVAGLCGCFLAPQITALILALVCVYFVWKIQRFQNDNESIKRQLQKILEILEKQEAKTANGEVTEEKADTLPAGEAGKAE